MNLPRRCYLIPPNEQPCVWMIANQLSYQLCDRSMDCDDCPVDAAMHRRPYKPSEGEAAGLFGPTWPPEIPQEGFQYSRNHWWARKADQGRLRLGLEPGLAQALLTVKGIVFPSTHMHVRKGQVCIWVVMDGGTLALEAPLDGFVRTVNRELVDKPHLLRSHPLDDGWLYEMEPDDETAAAAELMTADLVRTKYARDRSRFLAPLVNSMRGRRPAPGLSPADGSAQLNDFADILGTTRYISLLRQYFGWNKK